MTIERLDPATRDALARLARDLSALRLSWAVVGGVAVRVHADSGATDDIDLAVALADDQAAETVTRALQERGYAAVTVVEDTATGRLASVRLELLGAEEPVQPVQLLFASSGIEPEVVAAATNHDVAGVNVRVASPGHLLALKILAHEAARPQDAEDIAALLQRAGKLDLQQAEDALVLIADRGFDRGRDLHDAFERFLAREPATS